MDSRDLLQFLNTSGNWYLSQDSQLVPSRTTAVSIEDYILYQVVHIEQATQINFESMRNILDAMQLPGILFFYVVHGKEGTLSYYYGISLDTTYYLGKREGGTLLEEAAEIFQAVFAANYPLNKLEEVKEKKKKELKHQILKYSHGAVMEGVPGKFNSKPAVLGADKVKQAMENDEFILIEVLKPMTLEEKNFFSTSVLQVASEMEGLANQTQSCVVSGSRTRNYNVAASQLYSNSRIRSNNETRKEFRIVDDAAGAGTPQAGVPQIGTTVPAIGATGATGGQSNTQVTPVQNIPTQTPTTNRVAEVLNGVLDKGILGEDTSYTNIHQPLEIQQMNQLQPRQGTGIQARPRQSIVPARGRRRSLLARRNQSGLANVLAAPNIPVGSALASQFVGSSLPLVDGDFLISDIERQVSKGINNTRLFTSSDNISNSRSNTNTSSTTKIMRLSDRAAINWLKYIDDLLYPRIDTGKVTGLYLLGTGIFAENPATLVKLSSVLKYTYNSTGYNNIPMVMTKLGERDARWESFSEFQLPMYRCMDSRSCFSREEIVIRAAFSQAVAKSYAFGGNYLSSQELSSIIALPL